MNNNLPGDTTFPPGVSLRDIDPETASRKMVSGQPGKPHEFMTFTTTITREIEVTVEYTFHKGSKGARDSINGVRGAGPPLEPDEPDSVEILAVVDTNNGRDIDLTPAEESEIEEQLEKGTKQ